MKKLFLLSATLLLTGIFVKSQTFEEAKKHLYYQRYESAKNVLQSVIAQPGISSDAWYWLGEIYLYQNKRDSARKIILDGITLFENQKLSKKNSPLIHIGWGHILLDSGLTAEAKKHMEDVLLESKYKDPIALWAVARANIDSKNGDAVWALELLDKAKKKDKNNAEIYLAMGDAFRKMIDGSNAVLSYNEALNINPAYAEAMYKKGLIYKSQNNQEIYIDRFTRAKEIDSVYTPAIYELYYHYFYRDIAKANVLLNTYIRHSDPGPKHMYMLTDLNYVSKKYKDAIEGAISILKTEASDAQLRLYKLIAYSYAATGDSANALEYMKNYFEKQIPSAIVTKDYELMAHLQEKINPDKSAAIEWYKKALASEKDKKEKLGYMITLAEMQKELGNREREAIWREKVYIAKEKPTNLDIYNWGIALYSAENYLKADSVFTIYQEKYPDQIYGYLWRARCNALIDTTMEKGLAIPYYKKLVEVASKDSLKNKAILLRAYGYLGTYEANITKAFTSSLYYFDKMLELDPENIDAQKYSEILKKWIENGNERENDTVSKKEDGSK